MVSHSSFLASRHTTLCTTLDIGLGVGWGDCIVLCVIIQISVLLRNCVLSSLLYVSYSPPFLFVPIRRVLLLFHIAWYIEARFSSCNRQLTNSLFSLFL